MDYRREDELLVAALRAAADAGDALAVIMLPPMAVWALLRKVIGESFK